MADLLSTFDVSDHASTLARVSKLLYSCGNSIRLEILFLLARRGELGVSKIVDCLELSYSQISQQMRVLKELSLVVCRKDAQQSYYRLSGLVVSQIDASSMELTMAISHLDSISISVNMQNATSIEPSLSHTAV